MASWPAAPGAGTRTSTRGHYPGSPITPGVLLCEAVFQTGALYLSRRPRRKRRPPRASPLLVKIANVPVQAPGLPGDTVTIEVTKKDLIAGFYAMSGTMKKGDTRVLSVDYSVAWKTPEAAP